MKALDDLVVWGQHCPYHLKKILWGKNYTSALKVKNSNKMRTLDTDSTIIFCRLIRLLNGAGNKDLNNPPYMPLNIKNLGGNFPTFWGAGQCYSLCHYYRQHGELLPDPEMYFLVTDNRKVKEAYASVHVTPCSFHNACLGIYEESISFARDGIGLYLPRLHARHLGFARTWLGNIARQGFLDLGQ